IIRASERPELYISKAFHEYEFARLGLWPPYVRENLIAQKYSSALDQHFLDYQFIIVDSREERVLAVGSSIPLALGSSEVLPANGWEWALATGFTHRDL